jgi:hypothetical protein
MNSTHQTPGADSMGNMVAMTGYPVIVVVVIAEITQAVGTTVWLLVMEIFRFMK